MLWVSTTLAEDDYADAAAPSNGWADVGPWLGLLVVLAVIVGGLTAVFWASIVDLPTYRIRGDGSATVSERALTEFIAADAWYVVCGLLVGLGLGIVAWKWFKPLGWPVAVIAGMIIVIAALSLFAGAVMDDLTAMAEQLGAPQRYIAAVLRPHVTLNLTGE